MKCIKNSTTRFSDITFSNLGSGKNDYRRTRDELANCNCIKLAVTRSCINHLCGLRSVADRTHSHAC